MAKVEASLIDRQVAIAFDKLVKAGGDPSPALQVIGRKLTTRIAFGFRNSDSPYGEQWKPIKARVGLPLVDTGRLRRSLQQFNIGGGPDSKYVEIGTNVVYAPVHQYGAIFARAGKRGPSRVVIPARPFMPIRNDQLDLPEAWATDTLQALVNHFKRTGVV